MQDFSVLGPDQVQRLADGSTWYNQARIAAAASLPDPILLGRGDSLGQVDIESQKGYLCLKIPSGPLPSTYLAPSPGAKEEQVRALLKMHVPSLDCFHSYRMGTVSVGLPLRVQGALMIMQPFLNKPLINVDAFD